MTSSHPSSLPHSHESTDLLGSPISSFFVFVLLLLDLIIDVATEESCRRRHEGHQARSKASPSHLQSMFSCSVLAMNICCTVCGMAGVVLLLLLVFAAMAMFALGKAGCCCPPLLDPDVMGVRDYWITSGLGARRRRQKGSKRRQSTPAASFVQAALTSAVRHQGDLITRRPKIMVDACRSRRRTRWRRERENLGRQEGPDLWHGHGAVFLQAARRCSMVVAARLRWFLLADYWNQNSANSYIPTWRVC
mmetsp:Transcript_88687/g.185384  ORF Transcript_88687/g.185384 Transcript_88687/m.185384 type:complete len:249 (+) Transcript_88687:99-845(+)